jgi:DNA-binding response OmpR family regulator
VSAQVLVVDADPESRALLSRVMGEAGFAVEAAEGPSDARVRAAERPPELVLLDLELPGDAAWPLLGELRSGERPPMVVGIGGAAALETLLRGVGGGVAGFVGRPVHLGDLLRTCRRVIDSVGAPEAEGAERRAAARHLLQVPLHVLSESGTAVAVAELVDLSASGARFLLLAPFETGARVRLSLEPRLTGSALTLVGEVRWRTPTASGWAHGVEFAGLTDDVRERLAGLVPDGNPGQS